MKENLEPFNNGFQNEIKGTVNSQSLERRLIIIHICPALSFAYWIMASGPVFSSLGRCFRMIYQTETGEQIRDKGPRNRLPQRRMAVTCVSPHRRKRSVVQCLSRPPSSTPSDLCPSIIGLQSEFLLPVPHRGSCLVEQSHRIIVLRLCSLRTDTS